MEKNLSEKIDSLVAIVKDAREKNERSCSDLSDKYNKSAEKAAALSEEITKIVDHNEKMDKTVKELEESIDTAVSKMAKASDRYSENNISDAAIEYSKIFSKFLDGNIDNNSFDTHVSEELRHSIISDMLQIKKDIVSDARHGQRIKNMLEGTGPAGGYLVPPQLMSTIVSRIWETSPIRQNATVEVTTSNQAEFLIDDELVECYWEGEPQPKSETATSKLGRLYIKIHSLWANPKVSLANLEDSSIDLQSWLTRKLSKRFMLKENTSFVSGDGVKQPRGFLTYADYTDSAKNDQYGNYQRGHVERIKSGSATDITSDGIKRLQNSLKEEYEPNAIWGIRRKSFENVITLKDAQGRYIFDTRFLQEKRTLALLGRPVVFMNDLPDVAPGALSMVYGDFREGYTIVDRLGIEILVNPFKSQGFIRYQSRKRVGGDITNFEAIKLMEISE